MDELVSRDKVIEALSGASMRITGVRAGKSILSQYMDACRGVFIEVVQEIPSEEDVARAKHGYWISVGKTEKGAPILKCSYCERERKGVSRTTYCRDCGAKMDLITEEV